MEGIIPRWKKQREGIIPRWKNHGRELFLGVKNNGREKFREGKIPYPVLSYGVCLKIHNVLIKVNPSNIQST